MFTIRLLGISRFLTLHVNFVSIGGRGRQIDRVH